MRKAKNYLIGGFAMRSMNFVKNTAFTTILLLASLPACAVMYMGDTSISNQTAIGDIEILGSGELEKVELGRFINTGPANLNVVKADRIAITGPLKFKNIQVEGRTQVTGSTKGEDGNFSELNIVGPAEIKGSQAEILVVIGSLKIQDSMITGETKVTGEFVAENSKFEDITITANTIYLDKTTAKSIFVKKDKLAEKKTQKLVLTNKSLVRGDVTFESGYGQIEIKEDSKVEGKIIGVQKDKHPSVMKASDASFWKKITNIFS